MIWVRISKSVNPDGPLIGIFDALYLDELYWTIDEFMDPHDCEFFKTPSYAGFLISGPTCKDIELVAKEVVEDFPEIVVKELSGEMMDFHDFGNDRLWLPVVQLNMEMAIEEVCNVRDQNRA